MSSETKQPDKALIKIWRSVGIYVTTWEDYNYCIENGEITELQLKKLAKQLEHY